MEMYCFLHTNSTKNICIVLYGGNVLFSLHSQIVQRKYEQER